MSNTSNNLTAVTKDILVPKTYETYVFNLVLTSGVALLLYATILKISREVEHIYLRRFSLPSLLYIFARYGCLIDGALTLALNLVPNPMISTRTCNILSDMSNFMHIMTYTGVQGLLIARAYSLCGGNKFLAAILALSFLSGLILQLVDIVMFNGCDPSISVKLENTLLLLITTVVIINDLAIFSICMWNIWDTWKLKHQVGIQKSNGSLVSVLLKQSILRCCFVVVVTITYTAISQAENFFIVTVLTVYQNNISVILVADFTLDLRQRNSAKIEASNISLPTLQISSVLEHVHQSFLVEMATPEDIRRRDGEHDDIPEHDVEPVPDQMAISVAESA